ncbi:MAG: SUMF1/EgtB/PvdO family nonheme iron enzyme, partial [Bacteroidota bacterium]
MDHAYGLLGLQSYYEAKRDPDQAVEMERGLDEVLFELIVLARLDTIENRTERKYFDSLIQNGIMPVNLRTLVVAHTENTLSLPDSEEVSGEEVWRKAFLKGYRNRTPRYPEMINFLGTGASQLTDLGNGMIVEQYESLPLDISAYEVTVGEYLIFAARYPQHLPSWLPERYAASKLPEQEIVDFAYPDVENIDDYPITGISAKSAAAYANWLSVQQGYDPAYVTSGTLTVLMPESNGYRLPSKEEWRLAANAADPAAAEKLSAARISDFANASGDKDGFSFLAPVGSLSANKLGFYDVYGNVAELIEVGEGDTIPIVDPETFEMKYEVVINRGRYVGGHWNSNLDDSYDLDNEPIVNISAEERQFRFGFRLARTPLASSLVPTSNSEDVGGNEVDESAFYLTDSLLNIFDRTTYQKSFVNIVPADEVISRARQLSEVFRADGQEGVYTLDDELEEIG